MADTKICLVTGANSGIGRAAAMMLATAGAEVVMACRNRERGGQAVDAVQHGSGSTRVSLLLLDLSSRASIRGACTAFCHRFSRLDVLIHNAADFDMSRKGATYTEDGIETVWATNHLGPVLLSNGLWKELAQAGGARIVTVASKGLIMHPFLRVRLDDPEFRNGGFRMDRAYYQSKLAQVMYTYWLAQQLESTGITANCVRVTNVRIDVARYANIRPFSRWLYSMKSRSAISPERMAETYAWLALSPEAEGISGRYFDENHQPVESSPYSRDPENIRQVMELTARYVPGKLIPMTVSIAPAG